MYKAQIICCIIIIFVGAFFFSTGRKENKSSKWFAALLIVSFVQITFDSISVYTVNHLEMVPEIVNRWVHNFYMGFMLLIFYVAFKYLEALIEEEIGDKVHRLKFTFVPLILVCIGVIFLPLHYIETPEGNYSHGPAAIMLYVGVIVYLILIIRLLIRHGKDIPPKKKKVVFISMLSEIVVGLYQSVVPTALITCLGVALVNLGIYFTVENPDAVLVDLLAKERKRADVANQAKTNFLANMSHEIRTPINAVLGMNEMILRESKDTNVREYARDVQGAANSLLSIINDILDITKIEAGKLTTLDVEYDFSSLIHDVTNMISFKAKAKELDFKVDIDENIPSRMLGDDIRIRQILVNLLNNAVKYTHEGEVSLEVRRLPNDEEDRAVISFLVKDTGIGIKEEDIEKLFKPFERIEEKRNRKIEGTGLGMSIVMQLLSMLNSKLTVTSEYGKGSEFSFLLEMEIIDAEPIGKLADRIEASNQEYEYQISFEAPDAKVLVVDDNPMNRRVFISLLKDTKIQIDEAQSGMECLEKVQETTYDIIFMDHMMPEMDGIETLQAMKKLGDYPCKETPVVILTANAIVGAKEKYLAKGFDAFLSKPIDYTKLEDLIKNLLDDSKLHLVKTDTPVSVLSELPMIDGLDWKYASIHFNDEPSMLDAVKFFGSTIEFDANELEQLLLQVHTEEGRKAYCTKVHSMKNSAAIIGIVPLAGMAKVLEDAARNNEEDVLRQFTPYFLSKWCEYKERLNVLCENNADVKDASLDEQQVKNIYAQIKVAAEDMDIDALDDLLKQLEEYHFDNDEKLLFENVKRAIINFDVEFLQNIE